MQGLEIVRAVMLSAATANQQGSLRTVEAPRDWKNLMSFQQKNTKEGSTEWNEMEILKQDKKVYKLEVTRYMFFKSFSELGMPELTEPICALDNMIFNAYLPEEVTFSRGGLKKKISDGAKSACSYLRTMLNDKIIYLDIFKQRDLCY